MPSLRGLPGRPRYMIAGRTHPKVLARNGEAYREALMEQVQRLDVADSVVFDPGYRNTAMLTALAQSAAVIVVPYDSTDQVTSGVLVDAIAARQPVVATAFPHAIELLGKGAGLIVAQGDRDALVGALRRVLTQPVFSRRYGRRGAPNGAGDGMVCRSRCISRTGASNDRHPSAFGVTTTAGGRE